MISELPGQVRQVARRIQQAGGRANLVGGAVIDLLQGRTPKDWDIEVFGLGYDRLVQLFSDFNPKLVGASFGIVTIDVDGLDIDLSVPRRDNRTGIGHKGFTVEFDPTMTPREAARRRDFTINSMALDLMTGELLDPFGGLQDLQDGILRVTDPKTFVEDPLRALRAMQLLARKAKTVDPATMRLIRSMKDQFPTLAKERLLEEFRKLFLKAKKPSVGLEFLRESEWIEHFPELQALIGLDQHPDWHPEGDVWTHSKMAADEAAQILHKVKPEFQEALMFGVFLHDLGKAKTTVLPEQVKKGLYPKERLFTAWGHDRAGAPLAVEFLKRLGAPNKLISQVQAVVGEHMQPYSLYSGKAGRGGYLRLAKKMLEAGADLELIGHMSYCDACATGLPHQHYDESKKLPAQRVFDYAAELAAAPTLVEPMVQGRDLIAAGFKPGASFAPALKAAFDAQMDIPGLTKEDLLKIAIEKMPMRAKPNGRTRRNGVIQIPPRLLRSATEALRKLWSRYIVVGAVRGLTARVPVDLTGWVFLAQIGGLSPRRALAMLPSELRTLKLEILPEAAPAMAAYLPGEANIVFLGKNPHLIETPWWQWEAALEHELRHYVQDILSELNQAHAGLPTKKSRPHREKDYYTDTKVHAVHPIEFYTRLSDEIRGFEVTRKEQIAYLKSIGKKPRSVKEVLPGYIEATPFFQALKEHDVRLYRKAVAEFYAQVAEG